MKYAIITIAIYAVFIISYIANLIMFFDCDFDAPMRDEVIHGIGVLVPILSPITVWF